MPVCSEADRGRELWPQHQVLRAIECLSDTVLILRGDLPLTLSDDAAAARAVNGTWP